MSALNYRPVRLLTLCYRLDPNSLQTMTYRPILFVAFEQKLIESIYNIKVCGLQIICPNQNLY